MQQSKITSAVTVAAVSCLKPNGLLFIGHSESLHGISEHFEAIKPALYRFKGL